MGAVVCRGEVGECALKKNSDGTSLPEERACLDCLMSKKPAEVGLQGAGRFIHHVQSQHPSINTSPRLTKHADQAGTFPRSSLATAARSLPDEPGRLSSACH